MNIKMKSTEGIPPTWDILVDQYGNASFLSGDDEELQTAQIAAFLSTGSTPQLNADNYSNWLGWMSNQISFGDLDSTIRNSLKNSGIINFFPDYSLVNNNLQVTMTKRSI